MLRHYKENFAPPKRNLMPAAIFVEKEQGARV
jgi:hypothetical protein